MKMCINLQEPGFINPEGPDLPLPGLGWTGTHLRGPACTGLDLLFAYSFHILCIMDFCIDFDFLKMCYIKILCILIMDFFLAPGNP